MRKLLRPTNEYAPRALLPGDPAIALDLAQELIDAPLMANHARGLWGYCGPQKESPAKELTIQSTGFGGQSAAAVLHQLAELGVRRAIRVGTCLGVDQRLGAGDVILCRAAIGADGREVAASAEICGALAARNSRVEQATVVSVDSLEAAAGIAPRSAAVDASSAAVFAAAHAAGVEAGAMLLVVGSGSEEMGDEEVRAGLIDVGRGALAALDPGPAMSAVDVASVKRG